MIPICDAEEKASILTLCREAIPSGKLLIAGTGCESTRATIALTRFAAQAGADAALVVTPHYYGPKMTPDALVHHYHQVADASPIPIIMYNVPKATHLDIDAATIARGAQHPNVVGVKESSGNVVKLADIVRLCGPHFQVLAGTAGFFFPALAVGAVGGVLALANIAPQQQRRHVAAAAVAYFNTTEIRMSKRKVAAQIAHPAGDILLRVKGIFHPHEGGGARHKLHQSLGALGRHGRGLEPRFVAHHGPHQVGVNPVDLGILVNQGL